jgi:CspA family cold shock protein
MGKKGRDRSQRRRGFDDEADTPPSSYNGPSRQPFQRVSREEPAPSGPALDAIVKWFNADKGFGFVELTDGSGDVFLHVAALQAAGHDTVEPNAKLSVQVGRGQKGRQVTAVLALDATTAARSSQDRRPSPRAARARTRPDPSAATSVEGIVKWYNPDKGFGFVSSEDGEKDVFVHASILERARMPGLKEGSRVAMQVVKTQKGREAVSIALLE